MSSKKAKIARKEIQKNLVSGIELLRQAVKPRPRWMPKWLWRAGIRLYFYESVDFHPIKHRSDSLLDIQ